MEWKIGMSNSSNWIPLLRICGNQILQGHFTAMSDQGKLYDSLTEWKWYIRHKIQEHSYLRISSLVALRDLDGLPVASSLLPYFLIVRLSDVSVVLSLLTAIVAADYTKKYFIVYVMLMYRLYEMTSNEMSNTSNPFTVCATVQNCSKQWQNQHNECSRACSCTYKFKIHVSLHSELKLNT